MTIIEQIKAEIERRQEKAIESSKRTELNTAFYSGKAVALGSLLSFLDTLESEKPMNQERLEKEVKRYLQEEHDRDTTVGDVARHFAQWGAEHLADARKTSPNGLEETADKYAEKHGFRVPYDGSDNFYDDVDVKASKEGFIAGAKWQAEQDKETIELAEEHAYLAGSVNEREKIIKESVEGEVMDFHFLRENDYSSARIEFSTIPDLKVGDKVRLIIVKKDD